MNSPILFVDDDAAYTDAVKAAFATNPTEYGFSLLTASNAEQALAIALEADVHVAIVDLALESTVGTDVISKLWKRDRKTLFIVHSVLPEEALAPWLSRESIPYTSRFFLRKTANLTDDSRRLLALTTQAIRCYVPYVPQPIVSVKAAIETIDRYAEAQPSFRRESSVSNLLWSQDLINQCAAWTTDRLVRTGYDCLRLSVVLTGSYGRLEASSSSDADYFVVFDDRGLGEDSLKTAIDTAYAAFLSIGDWMTARSVDPHGYMSPSRQPNNIQWNNTTLPNWFPTSSFLGARLGISSQLELTKLWFLVEGRPVFNAMRFEEIRSSVATQMGIRADKSCRDVISSSSIGTALRFIAESHRARLETRGVGEELIQVKDGIMRACHLLSVRLTLLQHFLDSRFYDNPASRLLDAMQEHPLVNLIQFHTFCSQGKPFGARSIQYVSLLREIVSIYAEGLHQLNRGSVRGQPEVGRQNRVEINTLVTAAQACRSKCNELLSRLAKDPVVTMHHELNNKVLN